VVRAVRALRAFEQVVERQREQRFDLGYAPARGSFARLRSDCGGENVRHVGRRGG
jgi:hypothetical protein